MKTFKTIVFSFLLIYCFTAMPSNALAFEEDNYQQTLALVVIDSSGNLNKELSDMWEKILRRKYRFTNYDLLRFYQVQETFQYGLPTLDKRRPYFKKEQMAEVANRIPADLVYVIWVDTLLENKQEAIMKKEDRNHEKWVYINMDITCYRKNDGNYQFFPIRFSKTKDSSISIPLYEAAENELALTIDKFKKRLDRNAKILR